MMHRRHMLLGFAALGFGPAQAAKQTPAQKLVAAAESQIGQTVLYDPAYVALSYPNGDVPVDRGVCTDVVIRAYRQAFGLDLQRVVHEDMRRHFSGYPQRWGLKKPDRNIDHRRVPNLQRYFKRQGAELTGEDIQAGDIVTMMLPGNLPHIVIVSTQMNEAKDRLLAIHNIGRGTQREDVLGAYPVTGHYRYFAG
jgi:uncharacterized protein